MNPRVIAGAKDHDPVVFLVDALLQRSVVV